MTLLATLARLEAAGAGRAQPLSRVRHPHLSGQPLVLIPLTLAGDPATPVATMAGTSRTAPPAAGVPQPAIVSSGCASWTAWPGWSWITSPPGRRPARWFPPPAAEGARYADAPQVLVPTRAARDYLGLLGRATRFHRPTALRGGLSVAVLGRWLTFLADARLSWLRAPGGPDLLLAAQWQPGRARWKTATSPPFPGSAPPPA